MSSHITWGLVATIKAGTRDILNFAAHHLDLGAHRVHIYLDEDDQPARSALNRHPKCRVILCDDGYWKRRRGRKGRPPAHQPRQSINATHCVGRDPQVDWLAHIDVDEFLWPGDVPLPDQLAALPPEVISARIRPVEALAPDPADPPPRGLQYFKSCARLASTRRDQTEAVYRGDGAILNGGFLSHVVGKLIVRPKTPGLSLRIHNAFLDGEKDDGAVELAGTSLCHLHAEDPEKWLAHYRYRLEQGSYREGLKPAPGLPTGTPNLHALLAQIEAAGGDDALRRFYDQVNVATPDLRTRLAAQGLLREITLDLDEKRARHFPAHA